MKNSLILLTIVIVFVALIAVLSGTGMMGFNSIPRMMGGFGSYNYGPGMMAWGGPLMMILLCLLLVGIVLLPVLWLLRQGGGDGATALRMKLPRIF